MPTAAERNALVFLAGVALIGGGVRAVGSSRFAREMGGAQHFVSGSRSKDAGARALADQISAVDSARSARKAPRSPKTPKESSSRRRGRSSGRSDADSSFRNEMPTLEKRVESTRPPPIVDVNRATSSELERLPRVGPALAKRIVVWRDQHGPFRSIEDLRHVHGIGPATAALLAPLVTF